MDSGQLFKVVSGKMCNDCISRPYWAGSASYRPEGEYFEVKLGLFDSKWYLSRNKSNNRTFTLFKKINPLKEEGKFSEPIGKGIFAGSSKEIIKLNIPLLNPAFDLFIELK